MPKTAFSFFRFGRVALMTAVMGAMVAGCASSGPKSPYPDKDKSNAAPHVNVEKSDAWYDGVFGGGKKPEGDQAVAVNAFLWRASLDTVGFMPIATADPFGGTIITDWYQQPEGPSQRYKLNVFILDRVLRADGVRVTVFKQVRDSSGQWIDARVDAKMAADIENAILTRARQLRIASNANQ